MSCFINRSYSGIMPYYCAYYLSIRKEKNIKKNQPKWHGESFFFKAVALASECQSVGIEKYAEAAGSLK